MNRTKLIELLEKTALITLTVTPEYISIKGNCSAIDDATDAATEKWIRNELEKGNVWAWCQVEITAEHRHLGLTGSSCLGACSHPSEEDFKAEGGYYADMKSEAIENLADEILAKHSAMKSLESILPAE